MNLETNIEWSNSLATDPKPHPEIDAYPMWFWNPAQRSTSFGILFLLDANPVVTRGAVNAISAPDPYIAIMLV